jgi:hypothetical protein
MSKQREALKIALKVLNTKQDFNYPEFHALQYQAFNMVYEALAEPEQKPVGIVRTVGGYPDDSTHTVEWLVKHKELRDGDKLYTAPPQRKPLTDEEIRSMWGMSEYREYAIDFAREIERAHGIGDE